MKIFEIYDSKADVYWTPRFDISTGSALRGFADAANGVTDAAGQPNALAAHPEDYTLFEVGEWEAQGGIWKLHPAKIALGVAIEFVETKAPVVPISAIQGGE